MFQIFGNLDICISLRCKIVSKFLLKDVPDCEHQMIRSWSVGSRHPVEGFVFKTFCEIRKWKLAVVTLLKDLFLKLPTWLESESSCQIYGKDVHIDNDYNDDNNQHGSNISNHLGVR